MRVLIWVDQAYGSVLGGHRVQMDRTADALRRRGVTVVLASGPDVSLDDIDVVHSLGARPDWVRRARQAQIPVVVSTIYWSRRYVLGLAGGATLRQRAVRGARLTGSVVRRGSEQTALEVMRPIIDKQLAFEGADLMLPNSVAEANAIRTELHVSTPSYVVPNGVDQHTFVMPPGDARRRGVLYAGRVEPHKNQLGLISALAPTDIPLTIVGPVHPHHHEYMVACRRAAGKNTRFIDGLDQAGLVALYQQAAVHAMPSWFETTGLASLEASLCGAAVVTTERGYAREYFEDLAHYCDPSDRSTIRAAIEAALEAGGSPELRGQILSNYTWDHTAQATLKAYGLALAAGK